MPSKRAPVLESVPTDSEPAAEVDPDSSSDLQPEPQKDREPTRPAIPSPKSVGKETSGRARRFARLVTSLALIAGIGIGGYVGWPIVRERYIQPVETTATDVTALREQLTATLTRVEELENELAAAQNATVAQGDAIAELRATTESLATQAVQTGRTVESHTTGLSTLTSQIEAVEASVAQADKAALDQAITMVAAQYLGRARLFLYQANYGLAEQDIAAALESLNQVPAEARNSEVIDRLTAAAEALPDRPVLAADELDIAWGALLTPSDQAD